MAKKYYIKDVISLYEDEILEPTDIVRIDGKRYRAVDKKTDDILDIVANLTHRVASLEDQLVDAQNNIEMLGQEIMNNKLQEDVDRAKSSLRAFSTDGNFEEEMSQTDETLLMLRVKENLKALLNTVSTNVTLEEMTKHYIKALLNTDNTSVTLEKIEEHCNGTFCLTVNIAGHNGSGIDHDE